MGRNRRLRMKEWLRQLLENGSVSGLCWEDRNHGIFKIHWKHGSQHGYSIDKDAAVFRMWAEHTGKYNVGDPCDPKRWKANFRCALNSLKDVVQLPDQTTVRGANAYRLFLFSNGIKRQKGNNRRRKVQELKSIIKSEFHEGEVHFSSSYQPIVADGESPLTYTQNCYPSNAPTDYCCVSRSPVHYEPLTPNSDVDGNTTAAPVAHFDYSSEVASSVFNADSMWHSCSEWQVVTGTLASLSTNDCDRGLDIPLLEDLDMLSTELRFENDHDPNQDELFRFVRGCLSPSGCVNDPNGWNSI